MRVGVPKEIKVHEYRVGLTPASVAELVAHGHEVVVETKAGNGIDCPDKAYEKAGAQILPDAISVFKASDMIDASYVSQAGLADATPAATLAATASK